MIFWMGVTGRAKIEERRKNKKMSLTIFSDDDNNTLFDNCNHLETIRWMMSLDGCYIITLVDVV